MLEDKIEELENKFDSFVHDFYNELKELKATNKSKITLDNVYRLICNTRATGFEPQKIIISPDVDETIWGSNFMKGYGSYLFGIPLEIKTNGYNTIEIISKKIDG